ncbi:MAG TPA: lantibiotic dehydratase [Longimicrobium sp.]
MQEPDAAPATTDLRPRPAAGEGGELELAGFFIARYSGLPSDTFEHARSPELERALDDLEETSGRLQGLSARLVDVLFETVGVHQDPEARRVLLRLKRDVHNGRSLRADDVKAATGVYCPAHALLFERYVQAQEELRACRRRYQEAYERGADLARRCLRPVLAEPLFQQGLLLSSASLFDAQSRYLQAERPSSARDGKTERGLLRYVARAAMKATPFSTLGILAAGRFRDGGGTPVGRAAGEPPAPRSSVRLNKQFFGPMLSALLIRPAFYRQVPVELNPTLAEGGGEHVFLTGVAGKEVFQRLSGGGAVSAIVELVRPAGAVRFRDLAAAVASSPEFETTLEEAEQFIQRLVTLGLLRFRTGIPEQEAEWHLGLRDLVRQADDPALHELAECLEALDADVRAYPPAALGLRVEALARLRATLTRALGTLNVPVQPALPILEDAALDESCDMALTEPLRAAMADLAVYIQATRTVARPREDQAAMRHFFDEHFPASRQVFLLQFYEEYHRAHLKQHLAREHAAEKGAERDPGYNLENPFGLRFIDLLRQARAEFAKLIMRKWRGEPGRKVLEISRAELEACFSAVPPLNRDPASVNTYIDQVAPAAPGAPLQVVLTKGYRPGFGKMMSRFLHLFDDSLTDEIRTANRRRTPHILAEICGDGQHNANLHPPLLPWELSYPTGQAAGKGVEISTGEILVERHPDDPHGLCLRERRSGRRVIPVDLGFLIEQSRPPLYRLLMAFTPPGIFDQVLPSFPDLLPPSLHDREEMPARSRPEAGPGPVRRPRIVFDGTVVLAREQWLLHAHQYPQPHDGESGADYFLRIQQWREEFAIPAEVYLRLYAYAARPTGESARKEAKRFAGELNDRQTLNLFKPQYIDFRNPLFVDLFGHAAAGLPQFHAILEERYPDAPRGAQLGGRPRATEYVVQFDSRPAEEA